MYAVIQTGGRQVRVEPGQVVEVDRLPEEAGAEVVFDQVLMTAGEGDVNIGTPTVDGAKVIGEVLSHYRTRKVIVFKYKPKERYRRKSSNRRSMTKVRIRDIVV